MTEFITRCCHAEKKYEVIIKTDSEEHYKATEDFARRLIDHAKPVTDNNVGDKCDYCQEDRDGYRRALGSFFLANPFHGTVWQIKTTRTKPRQIFFCPMCGRKLTEQPKGE